MKTTVNLEILGVKLFSETSKNPKIKRNENFAMVHVHPRRKKIERSLDILQGKFSTTTPRFMLATEYRCAAF